MFRFVRSSISLSLTFPNDDFYSQEKWAGSPKLPDDSSVSYLFGKYYVIIIKKKKKKKKDFYLFIICLFIEFFVRGYDGGYFELHKDWVPYRETRDYDEYSFSNASVPF
jgi:hypothetical protein